MYYESNIPIYRFIRPTILRAGEEPGKVMVMEISLSPGNASLRKGPPGRVGPPIGNGLMITLCITLHYSALGEPEAGTHATH